MNSSSQEITFNQVFINQTLFKSKSRQNLPQWMILSYF